MIDFGIVKPGTTLYIPFATYDSNDPSASVTMTGFATTDIEIYKDGSTTQRASDAGYALLDTDGTDFDTITGIHGFSVNLADNTTAGFYAAGSQYWVVVSSVTVDAGVVNFIAATFRIGYPDAVLNTSIASLSSQTSFTLTSGPAEDDALNGCVVCIHDVASAVQLGFGVISDYTGSTKTVTLTAGVTFTAAATDNIAIYPPANTRWVGATAQTAGDIPALVTTVDTVVDGIQSDLDNGTDGLGAIKGDTAAILVDTADIQPNYATAAELAKVPKSDGTATWNATALAAIESECNDALVAQKLDHLVAVADADDVVDNSIIAKLANSGATADWSLYVNTTDSLMAIRDHIGDGTNLTEAGGTGDHLSAIPWNANWDAEVESEVNDAIDTAISELGVAAPTATPTLRTGMMLMYMALRNKLVVQTSGTDAIEIYNDAGTKIASKLITDDGSDYTEAEMA